MVASTTADEPPPASPTNPGKQQAEGTPNANAANQVDEFGLKVPKSKLRSYQIANEGGSGDEQAGKPNDSDDDDDTSGFRTPLSEAVPPEGIAEETVVPVNAAAEPTATELAEAGPVTPIKKKVADTTATASQDVPGGSTSQRPKSGILSGSPEVRKTAVSEWSHMQLGAKQEEEQEDDEGEWQSMPAYATHTIYDDWGKILAREEAELMEEEGPYQNLGGAGKGYTKVQLDEDAMSATSMDDDTAYLFKQGKTTTLLEEDDEGRDMLAQMQATKDLLTEGQRIAYVGVVRICIMDMYKEIDLPEKTRGTKKSREAALESLVKWGQKMMVRLYGHMDIESAEQLMIEQLAEHGVQAQDLTPQLMQNARVRNPANDEQKVPDISEGQSSAEPKLEVRSPTLDSKSPGVSPEMPSGFDREIAPDDMSLRSPSAIADQKKIDIDLRWTVLCDLFLILVADSSYDSRSRALLERVGKALLIEWLDICKFEKRITDALEMQEAADKENWNEEQHMEQREKSARNRKLVMMGLATVGGGLVIGLSAGLLAPVIGAGLAAGFTTIGVAGTGSFFGGVGAAALITSTGVITGSTVGIRASSRRMGAVKTFEYRPLHNNKRVNLIVTVAGWMTGKVDDVRLPFSTVDPVMGDIYSVLWEPEMLQSTGQTINILATEALTQGLQQILGSTILTALMGALQLPIVLTKLSYLIDNPWNVSLARADQAGLILADSLIDRNLGSRPITLVGFSIGSRVIYACLKELSKRDAYGLVQNVYLYGSPMVVHKDDYLRARAVVSGRFVNGFATNDWILGYLFRATAGGIGRVAGLAPVEIPGIENVNVTEDVAGHMAYRAAMPKLMQRAGWEVNSLEFSEIEDPDPENHDKRQRELINEIEEARKELEKEPGKKGLKALFSRNKKNAEKQEWETYDERSKQLAADGAAHDDGSPVLFDVDAINKEIAELAAQGIEIKEIKSTLPPMRLDMETQQGSSSSPTTPVVPGQHDDPSADPATLRAMRSFSTDASSSKSLDTQDPPTSTLAAPRKKPGPSWWRRTSKEDTNKRAVSPTPPALKSNASHSGRASPAPPDGINRSIHTAQPVSVPQPGRNAWADDNDDHGGEEVEMTFE